MTTNGHVNGEVEEQLLRLAPVIRRVATRLFISLPDSCTVIDLDDLVSVGTIGALKAIERFDPTAGASLESYVRIRVRGAMLDEIRNLDFVPRSVRRHERAEKKERWEEEQRLGHSIQVVRNDDHAGAMISIDFVNEESDKVVADPNTVFPWETADGEVNMANVEQLLGILTERERSVVHLFFWCDLSLRVIAEVIEVTESRVCQILDVAIRKMRTFAKE